MIAIEFQFPAGRYHATGWDHHVNEGTVEWPPSPWRILRAFVAAAHRLDEPPPDDELAALLLPLTALPAYEMPEWTEGHIRSYQPIAGGRTTKVFDAFVLPDRGDQGGSASLVVRWPDAEVDAAQLALLDLILDALGYLGRAESWVVARRTMAEPRDDRLATPVAGDDDEPAGVRLASVFAPADYAAWRAGFVAGRTIPRGVTVPLNWFDALVQPTSAAFDAGWSSPPGLRWVRYAVPPATVRRRATRRAPSGPNPTIAVFAIAGNPLPLLTDAVRLGDAFRGALMKVSDLRGGGPHPVFSGRDAGGAPRRDHDHAYYVPCHDRHGRIDRVIVCVRKGSGLAFDDDAQLALRSLDRVWYAGRRERERDWTVRLIALGTHGDLGGGSDGGEAACDTAETWRSTTPFVPVRHRKKRDGDDWIATQVRRELSLRGLPHEPGDVTLEPVPTPRSSATPWHRFRLLRDAGGSGPSIVHGFGFVLRFRLPQTGPIALGYAAHQGLGQFEALEVPAERVAGASAPAAPAL